MRPYLAVIRDSFHEALVSRVLWTLLALTTLFLAALVPLGIVEQAGSYLSNEDLLSREKLITQLVAEGKSSEPSPARRVWELFDESTRRSLEGKPDSPFEGRGRSITLTRALQDLLARRDFFRGDDWQRVTLPVAARQMQTKGLDSLADDQIARFNRLALEAAFPDEIAPAPSKQVQLAYFHWRLGLTLPVDPEQLHPAINQLVVVTLTMLLGVAGVFVAVLVTASMIPQAFEAGSVDLLLSKPIGRGLLFLAKFVGGCAFIAINAAFFIGGLWLILGLRFGLWNERLLWAIPLYLFLFAIYYSVSALAGLIWRNAIVSVVLAVVFWFVCWTLGTATALVETLSLNPRRIVTIVPAGDTLFAVDQSDVFRWDEADAEWSKTFAGRDPQFGRFGMPQRLAGPIYDPAGERLLAFRVPFGGFGPLGARPKLLIGKRAEDWRRDEGVNVADGAIAPVKDPRGGFLALSSQGIYRLEGNSESRQQDINIFGVHLPLPERGGGFALLGGGQPLRPLTSAAIDPQTAAVVRFDGYRLVLDERDAAGKYRQSAERSFERKTFGKVAIAGGQVFLALSDGQVLRYSNKLEPLTALDTSINSPPETATASPDGRYLAVLYRNERLWLFDVAQGQSLAPPLVGQGNVSGVAFDGPRIFVADRVSRVTEYDLDTWTIRRQWQGAMPLAERIYRYVLQPLYTVFPKPSQLNQTVAYVLSESDTGASGLRFDDPANSPNVPMKFDVWAPVWSNLAFLVVVLIVACLYVRRKDF